MAPGLPGLAKRTASPAAAAAFDSVVASAAVHPESAIGSVAAAAVVAALAYQPAMPERAIVLSELGLMVAVPVRHSALVRCLIVVPLILLSVRWGLVARLAPLICSWIAVGHWILQPGSPRLLLLLGSSLGG